MTIANPIYDAVFKFMMNDHQVAKLLLSAIIGAEIESLSVQTTEIPMPISASVTVFRMDFKAKIKQVDGEEKIVILEIQKAKLATDIMRFRRYLSQQYADRNNSLLIETKTTKKGEDIEVRKPLPILSIYFLGHTLQYAKNIPVIKVDRTYWDVATGTPIHEKVDFIESLTHDSFIIQIPYITGNRRTELEQLLHIFDQSKSEKKESESVYHHLLSIQEEEIPRQYAPILRKLLEAFASPKVREMMYAEDEVLQEMRMHAREVEYLKEEIESKKKQVENTNQQLQETQKQVQEKEKQVQEKDSIIEKTVCNLIGLNFTNEQIFEITGMPIDQVDRYRK